MDSPGIKVNNFGNGFFSLSSSGGEGWGRRPFNRAALIQWQLVKREGPKCHGSTNTRLVATLRAMAIDADSPLDALWKDYSLAFRVFDDLTLARWLAHT